MKQQTGLFKNYDGSFSRYVPNSVGGTYNIEYDRDGKFLWTGIPWQLDPSMDDLTTDEMAKARGN